ncbi:alpha-lytic protease prodomain-containing protein [Streptomyces sp. NPDC005263]|uniref:alpha-lytic protease prodomain-containing protein n=1 Tax=Streptomyces sp. NPDC005263 TaxID=3364711 RepID=UPI0036C279A5
MPPRHIAATCAAVTALGALVLTALPEASAAASPVPVDAPSAARTLGADTPAPAMLRAMQRDLKLTEAQARTRLENEAEAGSRAGRLQIALGKRFAGAWVQGPTSADLTVATTDAADAPAIAAGGAKAAVVRHTLADLKAAKSKLDRAATAATALAAPVRYIDVRKNRVTVQATSRAAGDALVTAARIDGTLAKVKVSADRPRTLHDIRGGDAYYIEDIARCSVGFAVTKAQKQGFVSAGHCGDAGDSTTGFNQVAQGVFQASVFPGHDMSWVAANSNWTATPYVKGEGGQNVQVAGSAQALVGAAVCRSGSTTGWHCGTIQQHDTSVTYSEGTIDGVTRTTVCAEPGDSGGSYLSGAQAQGVLSGGSGDCTRGGTTFYQPVNPVLSTYGLVLKTNAAQAETPGTPAPTGSWVSGRVYDTGARVTYDGVTYVCLQAHQAQGVLRPAATPALWQRA